MIPVRELRVGNWVIINDKLIDPVSGREPYEYQIQAFDLYKMDSFDEGQENGVTPIPLTPEILKAVGFKRSESDKKFYGNNFQPLHHIHGSKFGFTGLPIYTTVKYLHQLQNVYQSLTGLELTYTPVTEKA